MSRNPRFLHVKSLFRRRLLLLLCLIGIGVPALLHSRVTAAPLRPAVTGLRYQGAAATLSPMAVSASSTAQIKTVWVLMMENENWSSIKGSSSAPYLNHTLLPMASYATQYYNPPGNHPSLPNYLWLEAGTNFGISNDDDPSANHQGSRQHLVSLLNRARISWKAYAENIDGTHCPLTNNYPYAVRHDPFVYFDDVTGNQSASSSYCISHIRPFTELAADLGKNRAARYNYLIPNVCDDMHDACGPLNDPIKQGDTWLGHTIPTIMHSQAYKQGGAIFIVWDEADHGDGPIGLIALSPLAKGHGYSNSIHYTHSSLLRTLQEIFGVGPFLGDAAHAADLSDLFLPGAITRPAAPVPAGPGGNWRLAFDDEFSGNRLDTGKWQTRFPWGACSIPGNHELQCYTSSAFSEGGGHLRIVAQKQPGSSAAYSSGMISSYSSYSTTYGYFELRAQIPKGQGLWPTFWLLPHDQSWPPEIDVLEMRGSQPATAYMSNHFGPRNRPQSARVAWQGPDLSAGFHTYGVDWEPTAITWYIDGVQRFRTTTHIPNKPMYMIVNLAVGGDWPGNPNAATPFPSYLTLDYLRAFVRA